MTEADEKRVAEVTEAILRHPHSLTEAALEQCVVDLRNYAKARAALILENPFSHLDLLVQPRPVDSLDDLREKYGEQLLHAGINRYFGIK